MCLSKGLGAPCGSLLVGPKDFITKARRIRKVLGGGMRQVGVLAAAGLRAIDDFNLGILQQDHRRAKAVATAISKLPLFYVELNRIETNIVMVFVEMDITISALEASSSESNSDPTISTSVNSPSSFLTRSNSVAIDLCNMLKERGVLALPFGANLIRLVTHRDVSDDDINRTIQVFQEISTHLVNLYESHIAAMNMTNFDIPVAVENVIDSDNVVEVISDVPDYESKELESSAIPHNLHDSSNAVDTVIIPSASSSTSASQASETLSAPESASIPLPVSTMISQNPSSKSTTTLSLQVTVPLTATIPQAVAAPPVNSPSNSKPGSNTSNNETFYEEVVIHGMSVSDQGFTVLLRGLICDRILSVWVTPSDPMSHGLDKETAETAEAITLLQLLQGIDVESHLPRDSLAAKFASVNNIAPASNAGASGSSDIGSHGNVGTNYDSSNQVSVQDHSSSKDSTGVKSQHIYLKRVMIDNVTRSKNFAAKLCGTFKNPKESVYDLLSTSLPGLPIASSLSSSLSSSVPSFISSSEGLINNESEICDIIADSSNEVTKSSNYPLLNNPIQTINNNYILLKSMANIGIDKEVDIKNAFEAIALAIRHSAVIEVESSLLHDESVSYSLDELAIYFPDLVQPKPARRQTPVVDFSGSQNTISGSATTGLSGPNTNAQPTQPSISHSSESAEPVIPTEVPTTGSSTGMISGSSGSGVTGVVGTAGVMSSAVVSEITSITRSYVELERLYRQLLEAIRQQNELKIRQIQSQLTSYYNHSNGGSTVGPSPSQTQLPLQGQTQLQTGSVLHGQSSTAALQQPQSGNLSPIVDQQNNVEVDTTKPINTKTQEQDFEQETAQQSIVGELQTQNMGDEPDSQGQIQGLSENGIIEIWLGDTTYQS